MVRPEEFESPTFGSVDQRSIQLSYGRILNFHNLVFSFRLLNFASIYIFDTHILYMSGGFLSIFYGGLTQDFLILF